MYCGTITWKLSSLLSHHNVFLFQTDDFIIIADLNAGAIYTGPIDTLQLTQIPLLDVPRPVAVSYDPIEQKVYWTDNTKKTISRAFLDASEQEEVLQLSAVSGS